MSVFVTEQHSGRRHAGRAEAPQALCDAAGRGTASYLRGVRRCDHQLPALWRAERPRSAQGSARVHPRS